MVECPGGHKAGKGRGRFGPCGERMLVLVFNKKFWEEVRKGKAFEIKTKETWEPDLGVERNTSERRTRKYRAPMKAAAAFVQVLQWSDVLKKYGGPNQRTQGWRRWALWNHEVHYALN